MPGTAEVLDVEAYAESTGFAKRGRPLSKTAWETRKAALVVYVTENPEANMDDIVFNGHRQALSHFYRNKLNDLKRELGIPERKARGGREKTSY
jgi:hypothetical protein